MFKTILVPTDGSPTADATITAAVKFAKDIGAKIIGISVVEPHPSALLSDSEFFGPTHRCIEKPHDLAQEHVQKIIDIAHAENVPCETIALHSPKPEDEIFNAIKKYNCDLIFMDAHGRHGLTGTHITGETRKVATHATISVLLFRP